jgi:hypothetical protein
MSRDVDYCSGAALMLRRNLLDELGGLDERYAPAYYEDVDLAFEVRRKGFRVVYEPSSVVVHHEGGSHGTDVKMGVKAHQIRNASTFADKWAEVLPHHYSKTAPVPTRLAANRIHGLRPSILFIDYEFLTPLRDAGSKRAFGIIEIVQEMGFEAVFGTASPNEFEDDANAMRAAGILVLNGPHDADRFLQQERVHVAAIFVARVDVYMDWRDLLSRRCPEIPVVFDTVDLHHLRQGREAALSGDPLALATAASTRRRECFVAREATTTLVVSEIEKQHLARAVPHADIRIVSLIHDVAPGVAPWDARSGLLFIGGFRHTPNADGMMWFLEEVWPLLDEDIRAAGIDVVGSDPPEKITEHAGPQVRIRGWVKDTQALLESSMLSIAPLRFGAGVKGKVAESWAMGLPVVGTSLAFEGMADPGDRARIVAGEPEDWARAIHDLYRRSDAWNLASEAGLALVRSRFSRDAARHGLHELLGSAASWPQSFGLGYT